MTQDTPVQAIYLKDYLPPAFLVEQIDLDVRLQPEATQVTARLQLKRNPARTEKDLPLQLDGQQLQLLSVTLDGAPLPQSSYQVTEDHLLLPQVSDQFVLETRVSINPAANTALEGLYLSSGNFCTQCEAEGFRRITYYPDRPDVLARFTTRIEADKQAFPVLLSNGNPVARGDLPDGRHFVTWEDPFPKPSYLFALVAGQLHPVKDAYLTASGRKVALELWVEAENLHKCAHALASLKRAMRWDEEVYGREYDLDIYMIVAVNDFNMGAMENKGLNIFNSACVLADPRSETDQTFHRVESVVAHEYFHNWSGNRVTCRDWFQLSLKEGFTVLRDQQFSADMHSAAVERIQQVNRLRTAQFAEDASPTAHPVQPDHYMEINNFYTLTIYEKGAEVVRMLRELLGKEDFRRATDLYFERFDGQAVTIEDFVGCMAEVSGLDLTQFMRWYRQAGTPEVSANGLYDAARQSYTLTLRQHTPPTPGQTDKQPLLIPVRLALLDAQGKELPLYLKGQHLGTETLLQLTQAEEAFCFEHLPLQPLPSLLRGFSAPVKLHFAYTSEELAFLMARDTDGFNRWDAGQQLALQSLQTLVGQIQQQQPPVLNPALLTAYRQLLQATPDDPLMLATQLQLPSEAWLAEHYAQADIDAIHQARNFARTTLARYCQQDFLRLYQQFHTNQPWSAAPEQQAARSLKNACLGYLLLTGDAAMEALAVRQFEQADNMTDQLAALTALVHSGTSAAATRALAAFAAQWQADPLVMDSWFSVQASSPKTDTLERVRQLQQHPAFLLTNPNKVRALIGTFAGMNPVNFHRLDGAGYQLLADTVIALNRLNPQIAARMVIPLTRFRRLDPQRQALVRQQLERIRQESLSADLYEILHKALT